MAAWGYEFYLRVLKVSLTCSLRSLVRDTFRHSKIKFISPRGHEISSIYIVVQNYIQVKTSKPSWILNFHKFVVILTVIIHDHVEFVISYIKNSLQKKDVKSI